MTPDDNYCFRIRFFAQENLLVDTGCFDMQKYGRLFICAVLRKEVKETYKLVIP